MNMISKRQWMVFTISWRPYYIPQIETLLKNTIICDKIKKPYLCATSDGMHERGDPKVPSLFIEKWI